MKRVERFFEQLAEAQHRRAGLFVLVGLLLAAAATPLVAQLGLDSRFTALLPEDEPSVRDLHAVSDRVGGISTLTVAIQSPGKHVDGMKRFTQDLVKRLDELPPGYVGNLDWNIGGYEQFVYEHRHLYADRADLLRIRDALKERLDYEKAHANPFYVDLDDEKPEDPAALIERMQEKAERGQAKLAAFEDGYYLHPDRDLIAVFVRTDLSQGDAVGGGALIRAVQEQVEALDPKRYAPDLTVEYAGDVVYAREEQQAIKSELVIATTATIFLVLLTIYFFFRKKRAIALLGASLLTPVLLTFAVAELTVDYLNTSTAFLGSIVIGNGVNPNIIWLARYFEERRAGYQGAVALSRTHRATWLATLAASLAAALAYGSLMITDFRGFRDFGIIGGVGMVLCWVGALGLLPAQTALIERFRPLKLRASATRDWFAAAFVKLVERAPKTIAVGSLLVTVAAVGGSFWWLSHDPLEYDFRQLRSVRDAPTRVSVLNRRVKEMVGNSAQEGNGIVVVTPSQASARALEADLEGSDSDLYGGVHTVDDLLPKDQEAKLPILADIRGYLLELRPYANEETTEKIDAHAPPAELATLAIDDLPERVTRPFTERDGTRGRLLVVENSEHYSTWDGRYLVKWAGALRELRLPDGERPPLAGRAPVFADMIRVVMRDGPKAIAVSFLATLLLTLVTFRRVRERLLTMGALIVGIVWMAAAMALASMRLNFLNFVAFPITFGNGVDYGVNVMRRYGLEREAQNPRAVLEAVSRTGGAVILCSLTTIIGYSSLYTSANQAINSFGAAMALSEITCLLSAVLSMPAVLWLLDRRQKTASDSLTTESLSTDSLATAEHGHAGE